MNQIALFIQAGRFGTLSHKVASSRNIYFDSVQYVSSVSKIAIVDQIHSWKIAKPEPCYKLNILEHSAVSSTSLFLSCLYCAFLCCEAYSVCSLKCSTYNVSRSLAWDGGDTTAVVFMASCRLQYFFGLFLHTLQKYTCIYICELNSR